MVMVGALTRPRITNSLFVVLTLPTPPAQPLLLRSGRRLLALRLRDRVRRRAVRPGRPGSSPRPAAGFDSQAHPPQLSLDRPDPHPPLAPRLPDRARAPGDFDHRTALKLVAVALPRAAGAAGARLVRDEQHGQVGRAPLEPPSESQQLAQLGAKLTIDEISLGLVVRDGRARYLTRRGS